MKISYFITPHGFGHASRACAVMTAITAADPRAEFQILTTVPPHVFEASRLTNFQYEPLACDVGLVQISPTSENLSATIAQLERYLKFSELREVGALVREFGPDVIVSDIAPLGLRVADHLKVPSVLVENFTWDWIYAGYLKQDPSFADYIEPLRELFCSAGTRIQVIPTCEPIAGALSVAPIARSLQLIWKRPSEIAPQERYVLISMGGVRSEYPFLEQLQNYPDFTFVIPGETTQRSGNVVRFAGNDERFYHPNLVADASLVVSKAGVSTVSEVYHGQAPFIAVTRPNFRESEIVIDFIKRHNPVQEISQSTFDSGDWLSLVSNLARPGGPRDSHPPRENGAGQAAEAILRAALRR